MNEVLFLLVKLHRQIDDLLFLVQFGVRFGREINESVFAVDFSVGLKGLAHLFRGKNISGSERESCL
jgi:hypothetical protein